VLVPKTKVPATVRGPVLTAPVAVTVVHASDKADKAPVATTAAQLTLLVVVKPNVPALTIPPAVRAPVVAAPETVSVVAETLSAAATLSAANVPLTVKPSQLMSPVVVRLLIPSSTAPLTVKTPPTVSAPVPTAPEAVRVAQDTEVVADKLPAATSPLEETDANVPAPAEETLVKPESAPLPTRAAHAIGPVVVKPKV
jgi:hypothetical protein